MQSDQIIGNIKAWFNRNGLIAKLIGINIGVFILILFVRLFTNLSGNEGTFGDFMSFLAANSNPQEFIYRPWTFITYQFVHLEFLHFLMNVLVLFYASRLFVHFFGQRKLLTTYLIGGTVGFLFELMAFLWIPVVHAGGPSILLGASASVMAVFFAAAMYKPLMKVQLFGVFSVPLILIAGLFLIGDLMGLGKPGYQDVGVAHFAHIGGAAFGALSIINANSSNNIMNRIDRFLLRIKLPKFTFNRQPKMKTYVNETKASTMTDDEYNADKVKRQERIDAILEKISKKGYDGLTKEEKDILFKESKR